MLESGKQGGGGRKRSERGRIRNGWRLTVKKLSCPEAELTCKSAQLLDTPVREWRTE